MNPPISKEDSTVVPPPERRHGPRRVVEPGRRAEDKEVTNDHLRALIQSLEKALDREREDRIREREEMNQKIKSLENRFDRADERSTQTRITLIKWGAPVSAFIAFFIWLGPTRFKTMVMSMFGSTP